MNRRAATSILTILVLCVLAAPVLAAPDLPEPALPQNIHVLSQQALDLRTAGELVPYAPPQSVLAALFTADESAPKAIYGPISAYVETRACPTTWLIAGSELARVERLAAQKRGSTYEVNLTLEEDCKGQVAHAVFTAAPNSTPEAWLRWRSSQPGRKAGAAQGSNLTGLRKAVAAGLVLTAELRGLSVNGTPVAKGLEEALRDEGRLSPVFDLQTGLRSGE